MRIEMELPEEAIDELVCQSLRETYQRMLIDLHRNETGDVTLPLFDSDLAADRIKIKEFIKSLEQVMDWYGA